MSNIVNKLYQNNSIIYKVILFLVATVAMVLLIFIDSTGLDFEVDGGWVDLLKSLLITVYVAYFGSRGAEKFKTIQKN